MHKIEKMKINKILLCNIYIPGKRIQYSAKQNLYSRELMNFSFLTSDNSGENCLSLTYFSRRKISLLDCASICSKIEFIPI